jgi:hypothetical protein
MVHRRARPVNSETAAWRSVDVRHQVLSEFSEVQRAG